MLHQPVSDDGEDHLYAHLAESMQYLPGDTLAAGEQFPAIAPSQRGRKQDAAGTKGRPRQF
jgi:hypothetical protein